MRGFGVRKYSCTICNKTFRSKTKHFNHIMYTECKGKIEVVEQRTKDQVRVTQYYGREYNFNNIPSGMRHLRSGLPLPRLNPNMRCAI